MTMAAVSYLSILGNCYIGALVSDQPSDILVTTFHLLMPTDSFELAH
jgi:hypothetical protein